MPFEGDPLAFYGRRILVEHHAALLKQLPQFKAKPGATDPFGVQDERLNSQPDLKVGILGAGIGGLYAALILESLGIEYEILETLNRTGGRLQTYKFEQGQTYDYYEAGAMRFPLPKKDDKGNYKNGTMKRLAELTEYEPLNTGQYHLKDTLIPYYFNARPGPNAKPGFYYFNGVLKEVSSKAKESFNGEAMDVHPAYIEAGADAINSDVINPFIRMLINDILKGQTAGWEVLKENDKYSIRAYMSSKYLPSYDLNLPPQHLPNNVIGWLALLGGGSGGGSGGFNRALTEAVFESLAFAQVGGSDYGDVDWKCFNGGTETLSQTIEKYLREKNGSFLFQERVTAIKLEFVEAGVPYVKVIANKTENEKTEPKKTEHKYAHVISTLPLPVLRTVDLRDAGLTVMQKNALRALDYGPSIKIAILFKTNWWTTKLNIFGGQSLTDLPIRTIVYPSYGTESEPCKVLIASYSWTTDALRLEALATLKERRELKELVLLNLAEAHGALPGSDITYEYLSEQFVDMDVKDWNADPQTMGAFAFFSPGDFQDMYTSLNFPAANNCLHFAGEALSTRHAWVVGALDSAWKAVYQYLKVTGQNDKIKTFKEKWGENVEWTGKSTLVDHSNYDSLDDVPDMLDQHLGLVGKGVQSGIIA